jgi:hypothetical protein
MLGRIGIILLSIIVAVLVVFSGIFYFVPARQFSAFQNHLVEQAKDVEIEHQSENLSKLKKDIDVLNDKLDKFNPGKVYIVINTMENSFKLYKDGKLIRSGICSTGSQHEMITDKKSYRFETPRGVLVVKNKRTNPVWIKPDWAFIEEGLPVPPPGAKSRYDENVLGDYALDLGNSYMIHGTLYQKRFLGQAVTHGCVRLNDEDLEAVFNAMQIGSKVFIY